MFVASAVSWLLSFVACCLQWFVVFCRYSLLVVGCCLVFLQIVQTWLFSVVHALLCVVCFLQPSNVYLFSVCVNFVFCCLLFIDLGLFVVCWLSCALLLLLVDLRCCVLCGVVCCCL